MENVDLEAPIMKDEIFGPILPIIKYKDIQRQSIWLTRKRNHWLTISLVKVKSPRFI